ncbi:MAG: VOC family protein [Candidatus Hodarchaeales archaeon]|jgi:predicted enzyme related to lactoylglutathione lyase
MKIPYRENSIYFALNVTDINRAKKFYQDIFDLKIGFDGGEEVGWCELELPVKGAKLGLNLQREGEIKPGSGTLTFDVTNIDATKEYLESKKVKTTEITDLPDMVSYFNMNDSEGNIVQIVGEPRKRTTS